MTTSSTPLAPREAARYVLAASRLVRKLRTHGADPDVCLEALETFAASRRPDDLSELVFALEHDLAGCTDAGLDVCEPLVDAFRKRAGEACELQAPYGVDLCESCGRSELQYPDDDECSWCAELRGS